MLGDVVGIELARDGDVAVAVESSDELLRLVSEIGLRGEECRCSFAVR